MDRIRAFINGGFETSDGTILHKINPVTGEVIAEVEQTTPNLLQKAVDASQSAQIIWASYTNQKRSQIMIKASQLLANSLEELTRLEVKDVGKVWSEAISADVPCGAEAYEFFGALAATMTGTSHRWADARGYTERVPLGICAGIGAWNYPTQIACWKSAPALAAGNAFILKPSEMTPYTANAIAEILHEAGMPAGLFQVVHGDYSVGQALCEHPQIAKISLTGGVETGRKIMAQSAATLKKVTLELGGKAPLIVFADSDFDLAVQTALDANFYTAGEVCSNATRVFVEDIIADKFMAALVEKTQKLKIGDPMSADTQIGAIISENHLEKILSYIEIGKSEGAKLLTGGTRQYPIGCEGGYFISPAIFADCRDDMQIVREEIFGPVMAVLRFDNEAEVIKRANDTEFGLGAGIITNDIGRAYRVADKLEAGNIWINSYNLIPPDWPFGGVKQSGFGRESSVFALESYSQIKATYIQY
ncbi:MAG: betaine-aldehyde dehydrogenase [Alphaproteobacteria bacterium]|nr:betaine-aldehyde dehydrogenase [Alphaproteobacteria bacterium]